MSALLVGLRLPVLLTIIVSFSFSSSFLNFLFYKAPLSKEVASGGLE